MRRGDRGRALRVRGRRRTASRSRASTRGRRRTVTRSKALVRGKGQESSLTVSGLLDYAVLMEEPLELALDLVRGLMLAARGMSDQGDGRALLALGRKVNGELHQVKGMLASLMKVRAEMR